MNKFIKILILGMIGIFLGKGCSYIINQQAATVDKKLAQREELFAKKYILVYAHTDGMEKLCKPSGYIPTDFIKEFKIHFSSTINENNKYIDNLKDFEIFQEKLQNLRKGADKGNIEAYNLVVQILKQKIGKEYTLKDYCYDIDIDKDKVLKKCQELLDSYHLSQ